MKFVSIRALRWLLGRGSLRHVPRLRRLRRRIELAYLQRTNIVQYRVERFKEMGVTVGENCRFFPVEIFSEPGLVEIGNNVIISGRVVLLTHDGAVHTLAEDIPNINGHYGRIRIGDNCFIGFGAIIMPNVSIGNNCIVAAGAVVFDSFPDGSVIIGNPARVAFKRSLYVALKRHSPNTIIDAEYRFPAEYPKELLNERIGTLPIRSPRATSRSHPSPRSKETAQTTA